MTVRGIALLSGGLDSILAIKICQEQGIEMTAISFETPFFKANKARAAAQQIGVPLLVFDITAALLAIVKNPQYGYGKNMNPCIDCHALMIKTAGQIMEEHGYDFIATGEVAGQRPMSQGRNSLNAVANESGYKDFLIRPLSAKLLKPTKPEIEGKVDRERLLALSGRGRKPQMELAKDFGIHTYATPAGGCLLTDSFFCKKLADLFENSPEFSITDVELLPHGRHFRISKQTKIIVGRNQRENEKLEEIASADYIRMRAQLYPSPLVVIPAKCSPSDLSIAASICLFYSDAPADTENNVVCWQADKMELLHIASANRETVLALLL